MIERKFVAEKMKEFMIQQYIEQTLKNVGHSATKLVRTPLGEKIIISASRPGLVVGKKGENIKKLTNTLKRRFNLENPQIEIAEVENPNLDSQIVAERIASTLERFGIQKFKAISHKTMQDVMGAGALGIEIRIAGKVPSARAKAWRFYSGYLKKCGNVANTQVKRATTFATLRAGTIGVQVAIMPPGARLVDNIEVRKEAQVEEAQKQPEAPKKRQRRRKAEAPKKAPAENPEPKEEPQ
ncbi:MAG: 30S ribosomal protein S3 [Candidatus Woesearchaeota archaeon]